MSNFKVVKIEGKYAVQMLNPSSGGLAPEFLIVGDKNLGGFSTPGYVRQHCLFATKEEAESAMNSAENALEYKNRPLIIEEV